MEQSHVMGQLQSTRQSDTGATTEHMDRSQSISESQSVGQSRISGNSLADGQSHNVGQSESTIQSMGFLVGWLFWV